GAYVATRPALTKEIGETVNAMAVNGEIEPIIGAVFNLEDAEAALTSLENRTATGKVVLRVSADE
ncbi:MAG: zinc-binding dehydrogenase, partial [Solirubrobacterales bacterium]